MLRSEEANHDGAGVRSCSAATRTRQGAKGKRRQNGQDLDRHASPRRLAVQCEAAHGSRPASPIGVGGLALDRISRLHT